MFFFVEFQNDVSWKNMQFSTHNNVIENVVKITIEFTSYPNQEILVKDLTVHACIPKGTYRWKFIAR